MLFAEINLPHIDTPQRQWIYVPTPTATVLKYHGTMFLIFFSKHFVSKIKTLSQTAIFAYINYHIFLNTIIFR